MADSPVVPVRRDIPSPNVADTTIWGSDALADMLRAMDIPYVLLNPGASFRGLHDSIVNHLGNEKPQMMVVLHEEHAVAIAHGFAKVAGKPLAAILHSNVGLMHGSMAIFDAWVDRVPVIVLGATGPVDAAKRRPWIDWIHTAQDQGALVRHFIKWDAQPASVPAAQEALLRARQIATTAPQGPVYVCFDAALQESRLAGRPSVPDPARYAAPPPAQPRGELIRQAAALLCAARRPVILAGRVSRDEHGWRQRVRLAETLNAEVLTDLKVGCAFPTDHPLHAAPSGHFLNPTARQVLRDADVVLSLDWLDLAGTLKQAWEGDTVASKIIQVSVDQYSHNGWSMDHQGLPPVDLFLLSEPEAAVDLLNQEVRPRAPARPHSTARPATAATAAAPHGPLTVPIVAAVLRRVLDGQKTCLMRLPLSWSGDMWDFRHPLDFLGYDGGGGIGSGPGMAIGSALALKGSDRLPVAVIGDGDYLMGVNALWTAANARIPLLMVVCNNRSFFNDEVHQEKVARQRQRPVENRWIGQRIANPAPDLASMARAQGLAAYGPVEDAQALESVLSEAVQAVKNGAAVVIDAVVQTGYSPAMTAGLTRSDD
ncbi:thiamine pyrophosphate-binding protein [Bordetella petrii]|uniref:thiamine pyrophosphate-binding protein n=1 Tax=Bordetella petrii TaxID=94624 RepID=UPI001A969CEC|nr:thiamine pyrophosphate-binding protein [Bordetella petrii]MBO1113830.1 thiamine pyrophosphate-binding protein [Bordetella petrii]